MITLLDGGMGTEIRRRGCNVPSHLNSIWSAQALMDNPEVVRQIHTDYINAGADIIITNNYAVTHNLLKRKNIEEKLNELTLISINLANEARNLTGKRIKIAASLPPLDTSYRADLVEDFKSIVKKYTEIVDLVKDKVDLVIIETMSSIAEAKGTLEACKNIDIPTWLGFTLHGNRLNTLPSGENIKDAIKFAEKYNPDAYLINCCAANIVTEALKVIPQVTKKPYGGYANAEVVISFSDKQGEIVNAEFEQENNGKIINADHYAQIANQWINDGATIIGGCCHTSPEHIQKLYRLINEKV
tara:strand:- start:598 stop:1500 length:903 start_codon:yes stop_codon:yes gene_type:complete